MTFGHQAQCIWQRQKWSFKNISNTNSKFDMQKQEKKPIMQWLQELPDGWREEALKQAEAFKGQSAEGSGYKGNWPLIKEPTSPEQAISSAFPFGASKLYFWGLHDDYKLGLAPRKVCLRPPLANTNTI
jgi:hypothetical protein